MILLVPILSGLAGWRLASLLVNESGPFSCFARARALAGVPDVGELHPRPFVGGLLSCIWCASVWTSAGAWLCWEYVARWPVTLLAAGAVAIIVEEAAHRGRV